MNGKNRTSQIKLAPINHIILIKIMIKLLKNIQVGKSNYIKIFIIFFIIILFNLKTNFLYAETEYFKKNEYIEIKILDKVSSKNNILKIKIGEEKKFKNLLIKPLKCKNSEFDDNPEITAYLQVKDITNKDNN